MASEVDICNLALSHLGDSATVSSIDPPEGSPQAGRCARWYPIARDLVLEEDEWSFVTRRAPIALLDAAPPSGWQYAYALPADCVKPWAVLPPNALNDYSVGFPQDNGFTGLPTQRLINVGAAYVPQDFVVETDTSGAKLLYTNQENAVLRYNMRMLDPTRFSAMVVDAIAWKLASYLAGPIIKGDAGAQAARTAGAAYEVAVAKAKVADANARQVTVKQVVSWIAGR